MSNGDSYLCRTSKEKSAKLERNSRGIRIVDSPLILVRGEELGSDAVIGLAKQSLSVICVIWTIS